MLNRKGRKMEQRLRGKLFVIAVLMVLVITLFGCNKQDAKPGTNTNLILATTTSTNDTGLLHELLPAFKEKTGFDVSVISVGTGQAMEIGRNGDADVILVHARSAEDHFVEEGYGVNRRDVMYNDFIVLGPDSDPAGIKGLRIEDAFSKIAADGNVKFVSRGDNSGTHQKELAVWESINIEPVGDWYVSIGKGMGDTINTADEMLGYTLADRGTFIKMAKNTELGIVLEGDGQLLNPYGIIPVNPELHSHVNYEGAEALAEFITSEEGKARINGFQLEGKQLFFAE